MKFYSFDMMKKEKKKVYDNLEKEGLGGYELGKTLLEIYSLKGKFMFLPLRLEVMIYLRKKDWLSEEEFKSGLECLVGEYLIC